jgi:hypothetical protein
MEDELLGEHIEAGSLVVDNEIHAHDGFVSGFEGIDHECGARVEGIRLERLFGIIVWLDVDNALADTVEPVSGFVIGLRLPGAVKELIQFLYLRLYALTPSDISARLLEQIAVLEVHDLSRRINLDDVKDIVPDVLGAVEDGLNASGVPVQKLLLEHIHDVVHKSGIQFLFDILGVDVLKRGVDV